MAVQVAVTAAAEADPAAGPAAEAEAAPVAATAQRAPTSTSARLSADTPSARTVRAFGCHRPAVSRRASRSPKERAGVRIR